MPLAGAQLQRRAQQQLQCVRPPSTPALFAAAFLLTARHGFQMPSGERAKHPSLHCTQMAPSSGARGEVHPAGLAASLKPMPICIPAAATALPLLVAGLGRWRRACAAAQQPAASGEPQGSAPAGSGSCNCTCGGGGDTRWPVFQWLQLKFKQDRKMKYRLAGFAAAVVMMVIIYKLVFWIPAFGPWFFWGSAPYLTSCTVFI